MLNQLAINNDITEVKLRADDAIFSLLPFDQFKTLANEYIKSLFIWIMRPIVKVRSAVDKQRLLEQFHADPLTGGHTGIKGAYENIRSGYNWKGMAKDESDHVKACASCRVNKPRPHTY